MGEITKMGKNIDKNKFYWSCYYIERGLVCIPHEISFCCQRSHVPMSIYPDSEPEKTINRFFQMKRDIIKMNQTPEAPCKGCELFQYRAWEQRDEIEWLSFSTHSYCQFSCIYCNLQNIFSEDKNKEEYYDCIAIAKELKKNNFLSSRLIIGCAPGEITVHPRREEFYDFIEENADSVTFVSNAGVFDEHMAQIMKRKKSDMVVSIDSGTVETFKKVRGIDRFYKVWENLKKYREYTSKIILKYILIDENCQKEDLEGFVELCRDIQPSQIIISGDMHKSSGIQLDVKSEDKIIDAATYLCNKIIKNHMYFRFEDYLGSDNIKEITSNLKLLPEVAVAGEILDKLLKQKRIIFYGAGANAEIILRKFEVIGLTKPDLLWDICVEKECNKDYEQNRYGYSLAFPDFENLQEDDAVFITIVDEKINKQLIDTMEKFNFKNYISQYDLSLALLIKQSC